MDAVQAVNQIHADLAGFVFAKSRRQVSIDQARQLRESLDHQIPTVGVFIEPDLELIQQLADQHIINIIQIHGEQNQSTINSIHEMHLKVTQVLHPGQTLLTEPDYVMYDGINPGSGHQIDWDNIAQVRQPFFLAGGLDPANVETAINQVHPDFVDVSSGVETDGHKDPAKIIEFTRRAHYARNEARNK